MNHLDQFPVTTISFNVPDNYSLGEAVEAISPPNSRWISRPIFAPSSGQLAGLPVGARQHRLAGGRRGGGDVYRAGVLYESFIHPITILSTLPTAGVGALLALWLAGSELDVIAIIGIILLIGIVKKNAIMMIDFALAAEREQGMQPREAIYRACLLRFGRS